MTEKSPAEIVSRAIDPDWWKWWDVHGAPELIEKDVLRYERKVAEGQRAIDAYEALKSSPSAETTSDERVTNEHVSKIYGECPTHGRYVLMVPCCSTLPSNPDRLIAAMRTIEHSIAQARIPGNDWRRELVLIESVVYQALSASPAQKQTDPRCDRKAEENALEYAISLVTKEADGAMKARASRDVVDGIENHESALKAMLARTAPDRPGE